MEEESPPARPAISKAVCFLPLPGGLPSAPSSRWGSWETGSLGEAGAAF